MERIIFFLTLLIGLWLICFFRRHRYGFSTIQSTLISIMTVAFGVLGTYLLGWLEAGEFGAISYYGSVFAVPLIMAPMSWVTRTAYGKIMDYCTPCGSAAISTGKLFCRIQGCCGGRIVGYHEDQTPIVFPSQIVEMSFGLLLFALFILMERNNRCKSNRYPLFMILYGCGRFALNYFRNTESWFGVLPSGNLWSIVAVAIGVFWLVNQTNLSHVAKRKT